MCGICSNQEPREVKEKSVTATSQYERTTFLDLLIRKKVDGCNDHLITVFTV